VYGAETQRHETLLLIGPGSYRFRVRQPGPEGKIAHSVSVFDKGTGEHTGRHAVCRRALRDAPGIPPRGLPYAMPANHSLTDGSNVEQKNPATKKVAGSGMQKIRAITSSEAEPCR
jgi:hypothetical protein